MFTKDLTIIKTFNISRDSNGNLSNVSDVKMIDLKIIPNRSN